MNKLHKTCLTLMPLFMTFMVTSFVHADSNADRQQEIIKKWQQDKPLFSGNPFEKNPQLRAPYYGGKLKAQFIEDGIKMTNFVRFLSGIQDDVVRDTEKEDMAQKGAVLIATSEFSHTAIKPADMSEEFYKAAYEDTNSSNIFMGSVFGNTDNATVYGSSVSADTLWGSIRDGYMDDSDLGNISRVGHRRWILNPKLSKVAFGYVKKSNPDKSMSVAYSTMKVFDMSRENTVDYNIVAWPGEGSFPYEFFDKGYMAWSVSLNPNKYEIKDDKKVKLILKRKSDNKIWSFDLNQKGINILKQNAKYFNIEKNGYGIPLCLIFRPDGIKNYNFGDTFDISIEGVTDRKGTDTSINYSVDFFSLFPIKSIKFSLPNVTLYTDQNGKQLNANIDSEESKRKKVTYTTNNTSIIKLYDNGYVTPIKAGNATVTAECEGKKATCVITVAKPKQNKSSYGKIQNSKKYSKKNIVKKSKNSGATSKGSGKSVYDWKNIYCVTDYKANKLIFTIRDGNIFKALGKQNFAIKDINGKIQDFSIVKNPKSKTIILKHSNKFKKGTTYTCVLKYGTAKNKYTYSISYSI